MGTKAYKPNWVKGCRKATLSNLSETTENLMMDYCKLSGMVYKWTGLEKCGLKPRHMEDIIFWNRAIGITDKNVIVGCHAVLPNIYGEPTIWYPNISNAYELPRKFIRQYEVAKDEPAMSLGEISIAESIVDECITQASAYVSIDQNIIGMRTPVMVVGVDGACEIKWLTNRLIEGQDSIPWLDVNNKKKNTTGIGLEVLDLGVQNFLDPLTMLSEFMHAKTLGKLGIDALGTQKASGITTEEAVLILAQIKGVREAGLELRQDICQMIKDKTGRSVSVSVRDVFMKDIDDVDRENTVGNGNRNNISNDKKMES